MIISDNNVSKSSDVQNIVEESLKYLDTRNKFWKQTLPVHALRSMQTRSYQFPVASLGVRDDSSLPSVQAGSRMKRVTTSSNISHYVLREVFKVHQGTYSFTLTVSSYICLLYRQRYYMTVLGTLNEYLQNTLHDLWHDTSLYYIFFQRLCVSFLQTSWRGATRSVSREPIAAYKPFRFTRLVRSAGSMRLWQTCSLWRDIHTSNWSSTKKR